MSGNLIEINDYVINVNCTSVAEIQELQDIICEKCNWHSHPDRAKGKQLNCNMV